MPTSVFKTIYFQKKNMRVRKEYNTEKKKKRVGIFENIPKIGFNYHALVFLEQRIVLQLYRMSLLSNYQVKATLEKDNPTFSYTTIRRTLEDLFFLGWVGKRQVRSRTLYYLTEETRKKLEEQVRDKNYLAGFGGTVYYGDEIKPQTNEKRYIGPSVQLNPTTKFQQLTSKEKRLMKK